MAPCLMLCVFVVLLSSTVGPDFRPIAQTPGPASVWTPPFDPLCSPVAQHSHTLTLLDPRSVLGFMVQVATFLLPSRSWHWGPKAGSDPVMPCAGYLDTTACVLPAQQLHVVSTLSISSRASSSTDSDPEHPALGPDRHRALAALGALGPAVWGHPETSAGHSPGWFTGPGEAPLAPSTLRGSGFPQPRAGVCEFPLSGPGSHSLAWVKGQVPTNTDPMASWGPRNPGAAGTELYRMLDFAPLPGPGGSQLSAPQCPAWGFLLPDSQNGGFQGLPWHTWHTGHGPFPLEAGLGPKPQPPETGLMVWPREARSAADPRLLALPPAQDSDPHGQVCEAQMSAPRCLRNPVQFPTCPARGDLGEGVPEAPWCYLKKARAKFVPAGYQLVSWLPEPYATYAYPFVWTYVGAVLATYFRR